MNKFVKAIIAILGGINTTFSIIIPIFISFLIINIYPNLGGTNQQIILWVGYLSSFYRAISLWIE